MTKEMNRLNKNFKRLPDSELEIMMIIWDAGEPVNSAFIFESLKDKKKWKITSVLTFLSRLTEKGFIACRREGKNNIYTALIDERDYLDAESRTFLNKLYGNSITSFVSSLYDSRAISENDLKELREFIDNQAKKG